MLQGASQISFDGFVSALESIAEIKKVDTGMVYQAIASLNPEQMMWIHVHE